MDKFRVDSAGFDNRYRCRQQYYPHCELAYSIVYPRKDNSDYTDDELKMFRRMNKHADKYDQAMKYNKSFDRDLSVDNTNAQ